MRKRGKKLLAIMLAASMTLGQSGTLTAAQENAAEIIESVTFNAQSEDESDLLSEDGISDDLEGEESEEDGDTEQGDNEGDEENGGEDTEGRDTSGDNGNNPGANPIVDPMNPILPDGEETPNEDENPFTTSNEETDPAPENNQNNTVPDNFQNQTAETQLTFEQLKEELEAGQSVELNADITIPVEQQIVIGNTASLDLKHHKITVEPGRATVPIIVNGKLTLEDTGADISDNNGNDEKEIPVTPDQDEESGEETERTPEAPEGDQEETEQIPETEPEMPESSVDNTEENISDELRDNSDEPEENGLESENLNGDNATAVDSTYTTSFSYTNESNTSVPYTYTSGWITGSDKGVFEVGNINGGVYYAPYDKKISTLILNGTVIASNKGNDGGVARVAGAVVDISGGYISDNTASLNGGLIYADGGEGYEATVKISGGVLAGNTASTQNGGAISATQKPTVIVSGGTVAYNQASNGGGIYTGQNATLNINGGAITGNTASVNGGGIYTEGETVLDMTAGMINANTARSQENRDGGYWTGGGVFCSDNAIIKLENANVTANTADGFGGGIAGCSTGRIFMFNNPNSAFYGNSAAGVNLSGANSAKNADHIYAASNKVFMDNGYADYFCALNSVFEKKMCDIDAGWTGSVDGVPTDEIESDSYYMASYMMGLTAENKSYGTDNSALQITGNIAYTHGGGILCNGYLVCGTPEDNSIEMGSRIELNLGKVLLNTKGTSASEVMAAIAADTGNEFKFGVYKVNAETGEEAADHRITESDKFTIPEEAKVQDGYDVTKIPETAIFKAKKYGNGIKQQSIENNKSCLLWQEPNKEEIDAANGETLSLLKFAGTETAEYASYMEYTAENGLKLKYLWNEDGEQRSLVYKNGRFDVEVNDTEGERVKIYKLSANPDSTNNVITVTNSPYTPSTPGTPGNPDPTVTPIPSVTPNPSVTPSPSVTPAPRTTPTPSETPSVTPPTEETPTPTPAVGSITVTKSLKVNGTSVGAVNETFYVALFEDADHTKLSDKVSANIIPLSLNGASSISGDVEVYMESADEVVKLYVTEVDKNGTPVENAEKFNYDVTVENANVTISKDAMDASVKITNKEKVSQTPQGGSDISDSGGSTPQSYGDGSSSTSITPVKTGDNTPVMVMILLLAASALIIVTVTVRKRKHK